MSGWLYLVLGVIGQISIWPISKWGLKQNGVESVLGFWNTLGMSIIACIILYVSDIDFLVPDLIVAGCIMSIVYSIGFLIIIMHCLKIGPSGLTITINNSAMVFGIIYSYVYLRPEVPGILVFIGIAGVLFAIALIGISKETDINKQFNYPRWYKLVIIGGLFSAVSFMTQAHVAYTYPGVLNTIIYNFWAQSLSSMILLTISLVRKNSIFRKREMMAGCSNAFLNLGSGVVGFLAIGIYGSAIVFPVTVCVPIIVMIFIGRFVYGEKLQKTSYVGAIVAIVSIFLLAIR